MLCAIGGLTVLPTTPAAPAAAADAANFNAGNIINDAMFYNPASMSAASIQSFLNAKVPACDSGYTCLKSYRQTTASRAADTQCAAYTGASSETAATIIAKVAKACDINPQVILVTLEKEESLVTDTWPGAGQYRSAMGFGCPDTSGCDATYFGFFNQVYSAAHQFKVYRDHPTWFNHQAGTTENIRYNPNDACGSKSVTIANQATAGLYNYTPYTPNAAALNNLYGVGDSCSAYGNRNFWVLFTDWFGSTQAYTIASQLSTLWTSTGGKTGMLGSPTQSVVRYADGGVGQGFQKGWAYWSSATGAFMTSGKVGLSYVTLLGPTGVLGYPTAAQKTEPGGGVSQAFQKGSLYTTPAGKIHRVATTILTEYLMLGGPAGILGYPTDSTDPASGGGLMEPFDKGRIYWSLATGAVSIPSAVLAVYDAAGGPAGELGYPIQAQKTSADGTNSVTFEYGTISWSTTKPASLTMRPVPAASRLAGSDRYGTAVAISRAGFPATAPVVYVATGEAYPDALAAAPAAAHQGGPLLLTKSASLPTSVADEIKRLKPKKIVVVGGAGVVSDGVLKALGSMLPAVPAVRVGGTDRYATSIQLARYAFGTAPAAYLATGTDYPDALSASAAAATKSSPVLLVDGTSAAPRADTLTELKALAVKNAYVVGGTAVISSGMLDGVSTVAPTSRLAGVDRFATNQAVVGAAVPTATSALYATGYDYPDALSGAALSGRRGAPLYLVQQNCVPIGAWLGTALSGATTIAVLGGTGVVSDDVMSLSRCG